MNELFYHCVDFSLVLLTINILLGLKVQRLRPELKWFEFYLVLY